MRLRKNEKGLSSENLRAQILELIARSHYELEHLTIDNKNFGDVCLEVSGLSKVLRFTQDRGDVFVESKSVKASQWNDCLFLSHSESGGGFYDLLLKVISQYLEI